MMGKIMYVSVVLEGTKELVDRLETMIGLSLDWKKKDELSNSDIENSVTPRLDAEYQHREFWVTKEKEAFK